MTFGVLSMALNQMVTTFTQSVPVPPPVVAILEVQESGISQLGITQYLEIKI